MLQRLTRSFSVGLFERGRLTAGAFAAAFMAEWQISLPEPTFLELFATWVDSYFDGALALIRELRREYRTGCLSNTNPVHWERLAELTQLFDFTFPSHLTGFTKPDNDAYEHVLRTLGVDPGSVYFFDDLQPNVEAASKLGIKAFLVRSPQEIRAVLAAHSIIRDRRC
jgi:putative hydrolase of the HAD superfamily